MAEQKQTYDPAAIEPKWQQHWREHDVFRAKNPGDADFDPQQPKFYALDMFPYPSGAGLHVGHPEGYTATDIVSRYKRAKGFNVLHPMGWDAFGLPAEQYAIQTNTHPAKTTAANIETFRGQLQTPRLLATTGTASSRTCDPDYFKLDAVDLQEAATNAGSPTSRMRPSGGARPWARCCPTTRSSTAAANAATTRVNAGRCASGC